MNIIKYYKVCKSLIIPSHTISPTYLMTYKLLNKNILLNTKRNFFTIKPKNYYLPKRLFSNDKNKNNNDRTNKIIWSYSLIGLGFFCYYNYLFVCDCEKLDYPFNKKDKKLIDFIMFELVTTLCTGFWIFYEPIKYITK
jgi:hypothetical protein